MSDKTIHDKILAVMAAVPNVEKTGRNEFHKYDYVEAQEITRLIRTAMVKEGLTVRPNCIEHELMPSPKEGFTARVLMTYTFYDCADPDSHFCIGPIPGEGWDKGDKATPKALTNAFKYALIQGFAIPAGDDPEADTKTDEAAEKPVQAADGPKDTKPTPTGVKVASDAQMGKLKYEMGTACELLGIKDEDTKITLLQKLMVERFDSQYYKLTSPVASKIIGFLIDEQKDLLEWIKVKMETPEDPQEKIL